MFKLKVNLKYLKKKRYCEKESRPQLFKENRLIIQFFVYKYGILQIINMIFDYFDGLAQAIEFLLALGSIVGFLGLVVGILGWLFLGQFQRHRMIGVIIVSLVLLTVCGTFTGLEYFGIR